MEVPVLSGWVLALLGGSASALAIGGGLGLHVARRRQWRAASYGGPNAGTGAERPLFRGVLHAGGAAAALAAGYGLAAAAPDATARLAALIYGSALLVMLATSAGYHVIAWRARWNERLMRIDHANIFVVIAATYTPLLLLEPGGWHGTWLRGIWLGASAGATAKLATPRWPGWLSSAICCAFAWAPTPAVLSLAPAIGRPGVSLTITAGTIYTAGAVVYALRIPDLWPHTFGFHEVWHLIVLVATGIQWWVIADTVIPRL